ncbi:hypothetical protein T10_7421 [Trichinella papuae]|uniref:Uncharacterized protein n=1 Tax=Trichinella papuae TaxID=268474 RepID=A0A0V1MLV1_9BILA|nr:hypothetical protein T10_7421 [Trichinella papuae]
MRFVVGWGSSFDHCVMNGRSVRGRCWNPIEISLNTVVVHRSRPISACCPLELSLWTGVQVTVVELLQWHHNSQRRTAAISGMRHLWNKCHAHPHFCEWRTIEFRHPCDKLPFCIQKFTTPSNSPSTIIFNKQSIKRIKN